MHYKRKFRTINKIDKNLIYFLCIFALICIAGLGYSIIQSNVSMGGRSKFAFAERKSYFVSYLGNETLFNMAVDKTTITSFSRNTTYTYSQVEEKNATLISTPDSALPVYGWMEGTKFYWWSENDKVYFHPDTTRGFNHFTNIVTVDLTGTDTSEVTNFAHWFDKNKKMTTITGKIDTSGLVLHTTSFNFIDDNNENNSSGVGLAFMFNDCNALTTVDLSKFDTHNAVDMKRMFGGCDNLQDLDFSTFDTSNVKSMYWMFRRSSTMVNIDLSTFDTSNVQNMYGMFINSAAQTITFGEDFDTGNVRKMGYMFNTCKKLKTIFAEIDFDLTNVNNSSAMFTNDTSLIGGTDGYTTSYSSSYVNATYARIATQNQSGYFTKGGEIETSYSISYTLNGGQVISNPTAYTSTSPTFKLNNPSKLGYTFTGWTGSNGETPEVNVYITVGSTGNKSFTANFTKKPSNNFNKVFNIAGSCTFYNGNSNITSANNNCIDTISGTDFTNRTYIDTGIKLYNSTNINKDYEIYFEIESDLVPSQQTTGGESCAIMNTKYENQSQGYPGDVFRVNSSKKYEISSFSTRKAFDGSVTTVKLIRTDKKVFYSINGGTITLLNDNGSFNSPFNTNVYFGASQDSSGNPFRYIQGTISNMYIKLGDYE